MAGTASLFTAETWKEVLDLSESRQALWDAATTTVPGRKELIRTLVEAIAIDTLTRETVRGRIVWQDGAPDAPFDLPRRYSISVSVMEYRILRSVRSGRCVCETIVGIACLPHESLDK